MDRFVQSRRSLCALALGCALAACGREPAEPAPAVGPAPAAEPAVQPSVGEAIAEFDASTGAALPPEQLRTVVLPGEPDPHWIYVHDVNFHSMVDGKSFLVDGDSGRFLGMLSTGFGGAGLLIGPGHREIYSIETYYSRGSRGERTDVVTFYDPPTLSPVAEVAIPPKRAITMPMLGSYRVSDDGRFLLIFNLTPATSVSVVDLDRRRFAGEIDAPGCALIFPGPGRRFVMLCGDGSLLDVGFDEAGQSVRKQRTERFFDPATDPVTEKAVRHGDTWYFISFAGDVYPVDLSAEAPAFGERWSLLDAQARVESWRPGGLQLAAVHAGRGHLYVLLHQGGPASHKDPGNDIWVYDLASRQRIRQIKTRELVTSLQVSQDETPLLYTVFIAIPQLDIYDATSGEFLRSVAELGHTPTLLLHP